MSKIAVNEITDEVGTGAPAFPNGMSVTGAALTDPEITGGVYLGGTGSANYLDDYEEGTFTPEFVATSGGAATYQIQSGKYIKVGNIVTVFALIQCNKNTLSGNISLSGLPFNTTSSFGAAAYVYARRRWATDMNKSFGGEFNLNSNTIQLHKSAPNASGDVLVTDSDMGSGVSDNTFHMTATYATD